MRSDPLPVPRCRRMTDQAPACSSKGPDQVPKNMGKPPAPVAVIESDSDTDDLVDVKKTVDIAYYLGQVIYI